MAEPLNIALIGAGFVGAIHARAYAGIPLAFGRSVDPAVAVVVDSSERSAKALADWYGIPRWTTDWSTAVGDDSLDVIDICSPPNTHREIGLAALASGKHVYCEKPLGRSVEDARALAAAAERTNSHTMVGYNYTWAPVALYASQLIRDGVLGQLRHFRSLSLSDHASDEMKSWNEWGSWRWSREIAGFGALNDYGSHAIHMARTMVGEIERVNGQCTTLVKTRPVAHRNDSAQRAVDNDDHFAALLTFENGCTGVVEASRVATGAGGNEVFIQGSNGSLRWNQTQMNELELYVRPKSDASAEVQLGPGGSTAGFMTIRMGAWHPIQAAFSPGGVGLVETKTIEAYHFLRGIITGEPIAPSFADGLRVAELLDLIAHSSQKGTYAGV
jgi:predicted dehydrogenase